MPADELPQSLRKSILKRFPGEDVVYALSTDITLQGYFHEEWLVVTGKRILVAAEHNGEADTSFDIALDSVKKIRPVHQVGSGTIEIETNDGTRRLISYSVARNDHFCAVAENIQNMIEGKDPLPYSEHRGNFCEKCARPLPKGGTKCPACLSKRTTLARVLVFVRPHMPMLLAIFLLMVISTCAGLAPPYISKLFVDFILWRNPVTKVFDHAFWLPWTVLALAAAHAAQLFFGSLQERLSGTVGHKTVYEVRGVLYEKIQTLSLSFFDKHQTGAILSRVNQDTGELQRLLIDFVPVTLDCLFTLVGVGVCLFVLSWQLTLFVLIPIAATVVFIRTVFPRLRAYYRRFFHRRSSLNATVSDSLSGVRVVKAFGQESLEVEKFDARSSVYRDTGIDLVKRWSVLHPIFHAFIMTGVVLIWFIGGKLVFAGKMTIGDVVAYSHLLMMFYRPVFVLTRMAQVMTNAICAADRVFEIIDSEPEVKDHENPVELDRMQGEIVLKDVTFGYNRFKPVLKDVNVRIPANSTVGLVGKSGAGKSTIINLICRLYDVDKGTITVDDVDVRRIKYSTLRKNIGVVLQEPFLFNGSILHNIAYARPESKTEEIVEAAVMANAHEFIMQKPDAYDTDVGERGGRLSAGEKQRISIARAILRNPRILILDEATSSVDTQTEKKIQEALERLVEGRTTIAIAHRLSTLRNCDRLLVIDNGTVAEEGTHEELMKKGGIFHDLVKTQQDMSRIFAVGT